MIAGGVAGCLEAILTMPFEVVKTRQQIGTRESMMQSMRRVLGEHNGSFKGLYSGLTVQVIQSGGKVAIRFGVFQRLESVLESKIAAGMVAGACEAFLWITPCERVKIIRISTATLPVGETVTQLYKGGLLSLWTGAGATVIRNSFSVGFRFYLYDKLIKFESMKNPAVAGSIVGAVSTILNNPIDVIKSEMQARQGHGAFKGIGNCIGQVLKTKGIVHLLFAGMLPRIVKISIGQAVIFQTVAILQNFPIE